jgi:hypothetical protein
MCLFIKLKRNHKTLFLQKNNRCSLEIGLNTEESFFL